jgi:hypothetical protein
MPPVIDERIALRWDSKGKHCNGGIRTVGENEGVSLSFVLDVRTAIDPLKPENRTLSMGCDMNEALDRALIE